MQIGAASEEMCSVARLPLGVFAIFPMSNSQRIMGKYQPAHDFKDEPAVRGFCRNPTIGWAAVLGIRMFWHLAMLGKRARIALFSVINPGT